MYWIEQEKGEKAGKQAKMALTSIINSADEEMVMKIKQVVDRVADRVRVHLATLT
jgi:hypothetical protein